MQEFFFVVEWKFLECWEINFKLASNDIAPEKRSRLHSVNNRREKLCSINLYIKFHRATRKQQPSGLLQHFIISSTWSMVGAAAARMCNNIHDMFIFSSQYSLEPLDVVCGKSHKICGDITHFEHTISYHYITSFNAIAKSTKELILV